MLEGTGNVLALRSTGLRLVETAGLGGGVTEGCGGTWIASKLAIIRGLSVLDDGEVAGGLP